MKSSQEKIVAGAGLEPTRPKAGAYESPEIPLLTHRNKKLGGVLDQKFLAPLTKFSQQATLYHWHEANRPNNALAAS